MDLNAVAQAVEGVGFIVASLGAVVWCILRVTRLDRQDAKDRVTYKIHQMWSNAPPMRSNDSLRWWWENTVGDGTKPVEGSEEE